MHRNAAKLMHIYLEDRLLERFSILFKSATGESIRWHSKSVILGGFGCAAAFRTCGWITIEFGILSDNIEYFILFGATTSKQATLLTYSRREQAVACSSTRVCLLLTVRCTRNSLQKKSFNLLDSNSTENYSIQRPRNLLRIFRFSSFIHPSLYCMHDWIKKISSYNFQLIVSHEFKQYNTKPQSKKK